MRENSAGALTLSHFGHHPGACLGGRSGRLLMAGTVIAGVLRVGSLALPFAALLAASALGQSNYPPPSSPPAASAPAPQSAPVARNPACLRLEGQLAAIDRGAYD